MLKKCPEIQFYFFQMREELFETILTPPHSLPSFFPRGGNSRSFGSYQDPAVPFPRYSGARFCGVGKVSISLFYARFIMRFTISFDVALYFSYQSPQFHHMPPLHLL